MPSYIELDKQSSFPASSNSGKVILGINNSNQLQVTNSSGQSIGVTGLPYQVYTALLTQSGGDNSLYYTDPSEGPGLTIGVTYSITDGIQGDDDFTNVGAPSGETYPIFVATGTTPNKWENGTRTYYNTGAPIATVLENTIGNIWFTYNAIGQYYLNSSNLFLENKYFAPMPLSQYDEGVNQGGGGGGYSWVRLNDSIVIISVSSGDSQLNNSPIEIRVYN